MKELYNADTKERFLVEMMDNGNISEQSAVNYRRLFLSISDAELKLDKDVNLFTFEELEDVLISFNVATRNTAESYGRIISSYLNWSVKEGLCEENKLKKLKPDDFVAYINKDQEYISYKQLMQIEDMCVNYQDSVIIRLLFLGVGGKRVSEIRNLKKSDIDFYGKRLKLTESLKEDKEGYPIRSTERYMNVDDRTLAMLQKAINEKTYQKKNGDMDFRDNIRPYTDLMDNEYVFRPSVTRTEKSRAVVNKHVLYRRVQTIADFLGSHERFTPKYIQQCGQIYYANQIIQNDTVTLDDLKMVADQFNINSYHNFKGLLTIENIRAVYPAGE